MNVFAQTLRTLALVVLIGATSAVEAANKAGQILFSRGVVSIIDANDSRRGARTGADIFEGERLVTGRNGIVQLHLTDGTLIGLRGNSDYLVKRQRYGDTVEVEESEDEESLADQAGELFSGWMRMVTGAIGKSNPANVQQSTQVATIGIRGTVFQVIHVPEEGLPGYPDTDPGTYLMLEEGEVEITGEGGSRIVRPGEVVFVPFIGGEPRPAPDKRDLFFSEDADADTYLGLDEYDGQLDIADLSDEFSDAPPVPLPVVDLGGLPEFEHVAMVGAYGSGSLGGSEREEIDLAGSGEGRYPIKAFISSGEESTLEILPGATPQDQGYYQLTGQGDTVTSEVFWGHFDAADYTLNESPVGSGDWHYMLASQVVYDLAEINSRFPSGRFFYTFVGGTDLTGELGGVLVIDSGTAEVNLLNLDVFFELALSGAGTYNVTGSGSLGDFLESGGVSLFGSGISGTIRGGFAGERLDGMITALTLNDGSETFRGTALFEQSSGSAGPAPLSGLSSPFFNSVDRVGQQENQTLTTSGSGDSRVLTSIFNDYGLEGNDEIRVNNGASPLISGGVQLKDGTHLNWGAWASTDYQFLSNGSPSSPATDVWQYVIGDYLLPEAVVTDPGSALKGTFAYSLAGGTPLYDLTGSAAYLVTTADMVVNFATGEMFVKITTNNPNAPILESASAFLSDFYGSSGIFLADFSGGTTAEGTLKGSFFGAEAAGVGAYLTVSESTSGPTYEAVLGLVRGERADELLIGHFDNGGGGAEDYELQFVGYTVDGEGADRVVRALTFDNGLAQFEVESIGGLDPDTTGYQALADGTEVNWGIWTVDSYTVNASAPIDVGWHYMLADNAILNAFDAQQVAESAGLAGEFNYSFVGGTQLQGENFASNVANITGGFFTIDLSTSAITDFGMSTDNINLGDFITDLSTPQLFDLYDGTFTITSTSTSANGVIGGYAVGTGVEGLVTNISINDGANNENYFGTALFERGQNPVGPVDIVVD